MFISKSEYFKLMKALQKDLIDAQDANYEAFDELDTEKKDLIDKADRNDDGCSPSDIEIEWDTQAGNKDQVGLAVHTGVHNSEIAEAQGDTDSELYKALQEWGNNWAEKEMEMLENRLREEVEKLEEETFLSEKEAELYFYTEELGVTVEQAADLMDITYGNASGKRGDIKEKIQKAEKTAELEI